MTCLLQTRRQLGRVTQLPSVTSAFQYIKDSPKFETEKPYHFSGPLDPDEENRRTNIEFEWHYDVPVRDLRGHIDTLDLDIHGFKIVRNGSNLLEGLQETETFIKYLKDTTDLVKSQLNASRAICFDYRVIQVNVATIFGRLLRQFRKAQPPSLSHIGPVSNGCREFPTAPAWHVHVGENLCIIHFVELS